MNQPPLAAFLDDSAPGSESSEDRNSNQNTVEDMWHRLLGVLAAVVKGRGVEAVAFETNMDRDQIRSMVNRADSETAGGGEAITLEMAAEILASHSSFPPAEIRARIHDHLLVQMSRRPIDVETLAAQYGFDDAKRLRAKIEGEQELSLREYARLRVALSSPPR